MFAFIASEAREFSGFARNLKHVAPLEWGLDYARSAALHGQAIVLAANGPGPKLAARAAGVVKEYCELEGLVSIGFCGALDPQLQLGDIFVATSLVNVAHALSVPRSHSCERLGRLLSIDQVATSAEAKQSFYNQTHAAAIEM